MGPALLAALRKETAPPSGRRAPVLGNAQRRRVLEHFCLRPCGQIGEAAKELGLSPATVRFHALRLAQSDYLVRAGPSFTPAGLIGPDDLPLFTAVSPAHARRVLGAVYADGGLSTVELARAAGTSRQSAAALLGTFERLGLVTRVSDGRFVRVYPTRGIEERRERNRPRAKLFCDALLRRLEAEGAVPVVLRRTDDELQVRIGRGAAKASLRLPLEPFGALLG